MFTLARYIICLLFICTTLLACTSEEQTLANPPGYDMGKAVQIKLPLDLDEISGVAYYQPDSSVFAINDEKGWLYKIKKGQEIQRWKFSAGADFEDLVMLDSVFYVLQSNGNIIRLSFNSANSVAVQNYYFDQQGAKNEFEILYFDPTRGKLVLICKDCEADTKKSLTTFSFDPALGKYTGSEFTINASEIAAAIGQEKIKFKPSAAAINPADSLLYIISSINKLIVVTTVNGEFKKAFPIDRGIFKQPEGLAFTPTGGMLISNEAADIGVADILFFQYNKK